MDIHSTKGTEVGRALSNFAPHEFVMDGRSCASMEGFLQSLKFRSAVMQRLICRKVGKRAKKWGRLGKKWKKTQTLHWKGRTYFRESEAYAHLITAAYDALFQNEAFRAALAASGQEVLTHDIGHDDPRETVLTRDEFIGQLTRLRDRLLTT